MSANPKNPQRPVPNSKNLNKTPAAPTGPARSTVPTWLLLGGLGTAVLVVVATGVAIGMAVEVFGGSEIESVAQAEEPPPEPEKPTAPPPQDPLVETGPELLPAPDPIIEKPAVAPPAVPDKPVEPGPAVKVDPAGEPLMGQLPDPKKLSAAVKHGLGFLASTQMSNGGWPQGGGVVPGKAVMPFGPGARPGVPAPAQPQAQEADLGPTCIATLALLRSGSTVSEGPYDKNIASAVKFILAKVEKSDRSSLLISELKQTQLQHKIGPYVDTFLTLLVLAELKDRMGDDKGNQRVASALQKTISKVESNLKSDGTFPSNTAWAPVLSQGLAIKGLNRARQVGAKVSETVLDRLQKHALTEMEQKLKAPAPAPGPGGLRPAIKPGEFAPATDAGVALYGLSANLAGLREAVSTNQERERKARETLADDRASVEQKAKARGELARLQELRKVLDKAVDAVVTQAQEPRFLKGLGTNGGEEFLSFMNIGETLLLKGGSEWSKWDKTAASLLEEVQDKEGSWSGHHCITGKTFCTATALLTLMADRSQLVVSRMEEKK